MARDRSLGCLGALCYPLLAHCTHLSIVITGYSGMIVVINDEVLHSILAVPSVSVCEAQHPYSCVEVAVRDDFPKLISFMKLISSFQQPSYN